MTTTVPARETARLLLLTLAQAELEGRFGDAAVLRVETATALQATGLFSDWIIRAVTADRYNAGQLVDLAMRCAVVTVCPGCNMTVSGQDWRNLDYAGLRRDGADLYEVRPCMCGAELVARIVK